MQGVAIGGQIPRLGPRIMLRSVDNEPMRLEVRKDCENTDKADSCEKPMDQSTMALPIALGVV